MPRMPPPRTASARMHTKGDEIIKPTQINDIYSSHAHGSNLVRIEMLRGYNIVKEHSMNSEESTRDHSLTWY